MALGIEGALWVAPISDGISIIFTVVFIWLEFRKMSKESKQIEQEKVV